LGKAVAAAIKHDEDALVLLYAAVTVALPAATPVAWKELTRLPAGTVTTDGTEMIFDAVEDSATFTGNSYAFDNVTVNVAVVPI